MLLIDVNMNAFRCANVGLMPPMKELEMDSNMTQKEMMEYLKTEEREIIREGLNELGHACCRCQSNMR